MSNALRIDFSEGSYHEYLIVSIDAEGDVEFLLTRRDGCETDTPFSLEKKEAKMLADYLLARQKKSGGKL